MKTYQIHTISVRKAGTKGRRYETNQAQVTVLIGNDGARRSVTAHVERKGSFWVGFNPENYDECVRKNMAASNAVSSAARELTGANLSIESLKKLQKERGAMLGKISGMPLENPERDELKKKLGGMRNVSPEDIADAEQVIKSCEEALAAARENEKKIAVEFPTTVAFSY